MELHLPTYIHIFGQHAAQDHDVHSALLSLASAFSEGAELLSLEAAQRRLSFLAALVRCLVAPGCWACLQLQHPLELLLEAFNSMFNGISVVTAQLQQQQADALLERLGGELAKRRQEFEGLLEEAVRWECRHVCRLCEL